MVIAVNNASLAALRIGRVEDAGTLHPSHVTSASDQRPRRRRDRADGVTRSAAGMMSTTRDASHVHPRAAMTYEGTDDIHMLSIGTAITGIRAFR